MGMVKIDVEEYAPFNYSIAMITIFLENFNPTYS